MAANAFIIIRQHCYRRVLLVVPIIIIGLLWQKKVSSSTTCPATRLPKMDNNHRSNNYFFNDLWCQRKKDKEVKKSFVLAGIALFQYNLVPLFLKVPDQIDHTSTPPPKKLSIVPISQPPHHCALGTNHIYEALLDSSCANFIGY